MIIASCAICVSPLRTEIEKRDATSKADKTITWAKGQGVNINRFVLAKHRANHLDNGNGRNEPAFDVGSDLRPAREKPVDIVEVVTKGGRSGSEVSEANEKPDKIKEAAKSHMPIPITDHHFLDTVRDMVYQMLVDGKIELKVDSGFKAIEIKHKITEESQNEKMLLEILNEIRKEELGRNKTL